MSSVSDERDMYECIVIGAGPAGIVAVKELLEAGVERTICLEREQGIGGSIRAAYDQLLLTTSTTFSMFSDFWVGDGSTKDFWTKDEAVDYWARYAEHFGVSDKLRLGTEVAAVTRVDGRWHVESQTGEVFEARHLVLAIGGNQFPFYPAWNDELSHVEVEHSKFYRNAASFRGKRVVVVGGGESGSDIALEISKVAQQCWVSLRSSTGWVVPRLGGGLPNDLSTHRWIWDLPREFGTPLSEELLRLLSRRDDPVYAAIVDLNGRVRAKRGIWGTYGTKTLNLPRAIAHHGCELVGEVVDVHDGGRCLQTADGRHLENVDAVVFCTGYRNSTPFLPEALQRTDPRTLYKHMMHPDYGDSLAWLGWARPAFGSQFPIMELQARLFARVVTGRHTLPPPQELERIAAEDRARNLEQFEDNARRMRSLVDYHRYVDDLAAVIGCRPPLRRMLVRDPQLWLRVVNGPTQATQFRLVGPGAKPKLARELIFKIPMHGFDVLAQLALRARVKYFARNLVRRA